MTTMLAGELAAGTAEQREQRYGKLLLIIIPLILMLLWPAWLYTDGGIDPWVYHGYFHNYPEYVSRLYPGTYYGSRLSWVLPGYVLYHVFPSTAANLILHLAVYYTAVFSLYSIVRTCIGVRAAILTALMMGMCRFFVAEAGWDYVDGVGIAYYLLTLALFLRGLQSRPTWPWMVAAGAAASAMLCDNLFLITYLPSLPIAYLVLARTLGRGLSIRKTIIDALCGVVGVITLTTLFAAVNRAIGGNFLFFIPSIRMATALTKNNPWAGIWVSKWWYPTLLPLTMLIGTVAIIVRQMIRPIFRPAAPVIFLSGNFLYFSAVMVYMQLHGSPVLQFQFYCSYLLAPAFMATGLLLGPFVDRLPPSGFGATTFGMLLLLGLPYWSYFPPFSHFTLNMAPWILAVGTLCLLVRVVLPYRGYALALFLTCWCAVQYMSSEGSWVGHGTHDHLLRIDHAMSAVQAIARGRKPRFWYDLGEKPGNEYRAIASTYLWGYVLINEKLPSLEDVDPQLMPVAGQVIVMLSQRSDTFELARRALERKALLLRHRHEEPIQRGAVSYFLVSGEVGDPDDFESVLEKGIPLAAMFDSSTIGRLVPGPHTNSSASTERWNGSLIPQFRWFASLPPDQMSASFASGVWQVRTPAQQYQYAMEYPRLTAPSDAMYHFEVHYRLKSGNLVFGALTKDRQWLIHSSPGAAAGSPEGNLWQHSGFSVAFKAGQVFSLVVCNFCPTGDRSSEFEINSLKAWLMPRPSGAASPTTVPSK